MGLQTGINNIISSAMSAYRDNKIASLSGKLEKTKKEFASFREKFTHGGRPTGTHNKKKMQGAMENAKEVSQAKSAQTQVREKGSAK